MPENNTKVDGEEQAEEVEQMRTYSIKTSRSYETDIPESAIESAIERTDSETAEEAISVILSSQERNKVRAYEKMTDLTIEVEEV